MALTPPSTPVDSINGLPTIFDEMDIQSPVETIEEYLAVSASYPPTLPEVIDLTRSSPLSWEEANKLVEDDFDQDEGIPTGPFWGQREEEEGKEMEKEKEQDPPVPHTIQDTVTNSLTYELFVEYSVEDERRADLWDELEDHKPLRSLLHIFHNITTKRASAPFFVFSLQDTASWITSLAQRLYRHTALLQLHINNDHAARFAEMAKTFENVGQYLANDATSAGIMAIEFGAVHRLVFEELRRNGLESAGLRAFTKHGYAFFEPLERGEGWNSR